LRRDGGKRQLEPLACRSADFEKAGTASAKGDAIRSVAAEQDMAACERGMAAETDLTSRGEPAQFPVRRAGPVAHDEGGLGEIVLLADLLQDFVGQPRLELHDRRLVSGERPVGERIDMPIRNGEAAHGLLSSLANSSASVSLFPGSSTWPSGSMWINRSVFGKARHKSSSTRSMIACASATVISGGRSTWNWTKSRLPLVRVRKSWSLDSSGWRAARSMKRSRSSSGHSRSIRLSTASREARQAPHSNHAAMARPNSGSA